MTDLDFVDDERRHDARKLRAELIENAVGLTQTNLLTTSVTTPSQAFN